MNEMVSNASGLARRTDWLAALRAYLVTITLGNLVWESVQLPLYTLWRTGTPGEKIFAVIHCSGGDMLIGLSALVIALVVVGDRHWPARGFLLVAIVAIVLGIGYTIFSEWLNIVVRKSWAYSDFMPVMKFFGFAIGVAPLLQWIAIPLLAFKLVRQRGFDARQVT